MLKLIGIWLISFFILTILGVIAIGIKDQLKK